MKIYFDYDGPILDVRKRSWIVHSQVIKELGGNVLGSWQRHWAQKQERTKKTTILQECGLSEDLEATYLERYIDLIEQEDMLALDKVIPGVKNVLKHLSKDHTLILVTLRKNIDTARKQIKQLGIDSYFSTVLIGGERVGEQTYDAKTRMIKDEIQLSGQPGSILVGDTEGEIVAAKNLGLRSVAVLGGIRSKNYLQRFEPDYMISHIRELPAIISEIEK